jgi:hypothetical protein
MASLAQDAFHRLGPRSCDREMLLRVHLTLALWSFAPFRPPRAGSALSGPEPPWRATSRHLGSPLGSPWSRVEDAPRRLLQPTHDTSTRGSPDSRARRLAPRRPPPSLALALSSPSSGRLRRQPAFRRPGPRWSALDGAVPSFGPFNHFSRRAPPLLAEGGCGGLSLEGGGHLTAALSAAWEVGERPLTLSVAPRARPGRFDLTRLEAPRTASPAPSSKGTASSIQNAFHRQVLPKVSRRVSLARDDSLDDFGGNPPPVSRLCHRRPGFRRAFAIPCSRPEWLDPTSAPEVHHLRTRRAKRRLSTSAISTAIREHIRRTARTPRTSPVVAHERSCFANHRLSTAERIAGGRACYGVANRDFTGQGPALGRSAHGEPWLLPPRSLAVGALPQPDRLGHLLSRTRGDAGWSSRRRRASPERDRLTSSPGVPRFRGARLVGPLRATPREGDHATPHPRCLPSPDHPVRGGSLRPQTVPSLWTAGRRLFDPRARAPVTRVLGPRTRARVMGPGSRAGHIVATPAAPPTTSTFGRSAARCAAVYE